MEKMINEIIDLSKKLISLKSTPENKRALDKSLGLCLSSLEGFTVERFEHKGVKSVLIYNTKKRPKRFKVILNGHLDIIPGKKNQYQPKVENYKLYGVGAMDMKCSVACMIIVFRETAHQLNYPLGLQLVTDEELGGFNSTKYQLDQGIRTEFAISGETTNFNIEHQTKGITWLKISTKGKTAHGAYPWKGENAIWKMNHFLNLLEKKFPSPIREAWVTTINLARIETNNQTYNKIPDECSVLLDIRYIPSDQDLIIKQLQTILPKDFMLDIQVFEPAQYVREDNAYIKLLQSAGEQVLGKEIPLVRANGSSDARHFTRINCDAVEFGPIGHGMGTDKEWVDLKSLEKYCMILKKFLLSL